MANINLTAGDDVYVQPESERDQWNNVLGLAGNDTIRMYQGMAIGGPGNDTIQKIVDPANPNRTLAVGFWSAGPGLRVNLAEGWALDGEGGRDTLIGVTDVQGSGALDAVVTGDDRNNTYFPNGGTDTFIGGAGNDVIYINGGSRDATGAWREALIGELIINIAADGSWAEFRPSFGDGYAYRVEGVEQFYARWKLDDVGEWGWRLYNLADFITQDSMARDAIAAGGGQRWNAASPLGTAVNVSYSFVTTAPASGPGATGFRSFTEAERNVVRDILARTGQITNITFSEVVEAGSTVGQMRFGVSQQADTKGLAWLPNQPGAGDNAGDVWMDVESMLNLQPGSEGFQALLHEIGHALGLRHPRNVDPGDSWSMQLREQDDRLALTVMSGNPSSDGLFRADWGPLDVLALRYLYGTRATATGNTLYTLGVETGYREISIVDDGGVDTLDASALAIGVQLTLVPGSLSNVGISPAGVVGVDNLALPLGTVIENAIGTAQDDELIGNEADNELTGGLGNDWLDGGAGNDTAVFAGKRADYEIDHAFGFTYVRARDGVSGYDTLVNIERLRFSDLSFTIARNAPLSEDLQLAVDEDAVFSGQLPLPAGVTDRAAVTWALAGDGAQGRAVVRPDGSYTYTPRADYWGNDSFGFSLTTAGGQASYRAFVTVKPVNDAAPQGSSQTLMLPVGQPYSGRLPVASDVDGDPLTYALLTDPRQGSVIVSPDGSYTYTPNAGAWGDDSFDFSVSDGFGGSNSYSITLRMGLQTLEDTALATTLPAPLGVAPGAFSFRLVTPPQLGTMSLGAQGQLNFTPAANANGSDSFAYELVVGGVATRTSVALRIQAVNDGPPVGAGASYTVPEDGRLEVLLPRATDPDGDTPVYALMSNPTLGTATLTADGRLVYTPRANAWGSDTLRFSVSDSQGATSTYTAALTVTSVNDAPRAADMAISVQPGRSLFGALPVATDADGDWVMYLRGTAPTQGKVVVTSLGYFTYTANAGASGTDRFGFTVSDGNGGSNSYTVTVNLRVGLPMGPMEAGEELGSTALALVGTPEVSGPEMGFSDPALPGPWLI